MRSSFPKPEYRKHARKKRFRGGIAVLFCLSAAALYFALNGNPNPFRKIGDVVDALNGVAVYYNGGINRTTGRNTPVEGYNIGLRYQCVEFVKRYYYEHLGHAMPDPWGHARDFFDPALEDGEFNSRRGLTQYRNAGLSHPQAEDIVVFAPWLFNRFGHVAIVSRVGEDFVEIVQQNPGPFGRSRETYELTERNGRRHILHRRVLGWLRLPESRREALPPN